MERRYDSNSEGIRNKANVFSDENFFEISHGLDNVLIVRFKPWEEIDRLNVWFDPLLSGNCVNEHDFYYDAEGHFAAPDEDLVGYVHSNIENFKIGTYMALIGSIETEKLIEEIAIVGLKGGFLDPMDLKITLGGKEYDLGSEPYPVVACRYTDGTVQIIDLYHDCVMDAEEYIKAIKTSSGIVDYGLDYCTYVFEVPKHEPGDDIRYYKFCTHGRSTWLTKRKLFDALDEMIYPEP